MIENKTIVFNDQEYSYKVGTTTVNEILQNNINRSYPEWMEVDDSNKMYRYVEYGFFHPKEVILKILKDGGIMNTALMKRLTSKEGSLKYIVVLDPFGL